MLTGREHRCPPGPSLLRSAPVPALFALLLGARCAAAAMNGGGKDVMAENPQAGLIAAHANPCRHLTSEAVALATCFDGFDLANDAFDGLALQAMLDSGSERAVVQNIGRPWVINSSLFLRSHQTLHFLPGVELQARKGGFHCNGSSHTTPPTAYCCQYHACKCEGDNLLLTASNVSNVHIVGYGAILRMHQADYADATLYQPSEYRPAIVLAGVTDSSIVGLKILNTGGDGIGIWGYGPNPASERIILKDLTIRNAYRNSLSVVSARDLLVEDCLFADTCNKFGNYGGPCAGVDFEPVSIRRKH